MIDKTIIEQDWHDRGFSCDIWTDPPGQVWANFVHATDELVVLIDGEIELSFAGQTLCPEIGDEIFIPAGEYHTVINSGTNKNHWLYGYKLVRNEHVITSPFRIPSSACLDPFFPHKSSK